jgi:VanZ family protein
MLHWTIFRGPWLLLFWFALMNLLFFLPGSAFPKENWLSAIYFDKWVHIGLFFILAFLARTAMRLLTKKSTALLLVILLLYGLGVEWIQESWVINRSFDLNDVWADMTGALLGAVVWWEVYKKNKPL